MPLEKERSMARNNPGNQAWKCIALGLALCAGIAHGTVKKIACVGNSITYGYGLSWPAMQSYPHLLDSLLGGADTVGNFGNSGKTMIKEWTGEAYWTQAEFSAARAFLPDKVVIELGTNDSKTYIWNAYSSYFKPDYKLMIDTFAHLSSAPRVMICLVPHTGNASWGMYDTTITRRVNPAIEEVALENGVDLIDMYTALADWKLFQLTDSVHPNAAGALVMAQTVRSVLAQIPYAVSISGKTLTAPSAASYQWYRNDTLVVGATSRTLEASDAARYKVSIQPSSSSATRIVSDEATASSTGILADERSSEFEISLLSGSRTLQVETASLLPFTISVWDGAGRLRLRACGANGRLDLPLGAAFSRGVYHYTLQGAALHENGTFAVAR
jgi:lysophospholipase L1-like esterase